MGSSSRFLFCVLALHLGACLVGAQEAGRRERHLESPSSDEESDPPRRPWLLRFAYEPGWVYPTTNLTSGNTPSGIAIDRMQGIGFELGWQTDGSKQWHRLYRNPSFGLGFANVRFNGGQELGSPTKIYGWFSWPFAPLGRRSTLTSDLNFGGAFNWNAFDAVSNPTNDAVGTSATFYAGASVLVETRLSPRIMLAGGVNYSHYSNGGTGEPNGGVNTLSPVLRIRMALGESRTRLLPSRTTGPDEAASSGRRWALSFVGGAGWKHLRGGTGTAVETPQNFGVGAFSFDMKRRVFPMSRIGGGFDLVVDGSADALIKRPEEINSSTRRSVGVYAGYEHVIHRLSIPIHFGYYFWRGRENDRVPASYQKLGWKFDLSKRWFVGMDVRFFDFGKADFVSWMVGYRFEDF